MRAVSEDAGAAKLMGINTNVTISVTFAIGSALAAVGAVLYSTTYPSVTPYMGSLLGLKAFVAAVLGGIGSIPGAMFGGFLIGIAETLSQSVYLLPVGGRRGFRHPDRSAAVQARRSARQERQRESVGDGR